jgi:hypothetical protein
VVKQGHASRLRTRDCHSDGQAPRAQWIFRPDVRRPAPAFHRVAESANAPDPTAPDPEAGQLSPPETGQHPLFVYHLACGHPQTGRFAQPGDRHGNCCEVRKEGLSDVVKVACFWPSCRDLRARRRRWCLCCDAAECGYRPAAATPSRRQPVDDREPRFWCSCPSGSSAFNRAARDEDRFDYIYRQAQPVCGHGAFRGAPRSGCRRPSGGTRSPRQDAVPCRTIRRTPYQAWQ